MFYTHKCLSTPGGKKKKRSVSVIDKGFMYVEDVEQHRREIHLRVSQAENTDYTDSVFNIRGQYCDGVSS